MNDQIDQIRYSLKNGQIFPENKILMYHGVDKINSLNYNFRHIGIYYFERHLRCLCKYFDVVTLEDYFDKAESTSRPKCVITFDDGYHNNLQYALPILEKYNCPASIFICTIRQKGVDFLWSDMLDLICSTSITTIKWKKNIYYKDKKKWYKPYYNENGENLHDVIKALHFHEKMLFFDQYKNQIQHLKSDQKKRDYWQLLDKNEIRELANHPLITIGSHAVYHNNLAILTENLAFIELEESKIALEQITGKKIQSLAFPDGSYNQGLISQAKKLGYKYQLAVNYLNSGDATNPNIENRIGIYAYESLFDQYMNILK